MVYSDWPFRYGTPRAYKGSNMWTSAQQTEPPESDLRSRTHAGRLCDGTHDGGNGPPCGYTRAGWAAASSRWNVPNAGDTCGMFPDATSFNGDLSRWDVPDVGDMSSMADGCLTMRIYCTSPITTT